VALSERCLCFPLVGVAWFIGNLTDVMVPQQLALVGALQMLARAIPGTPRSRALLLPRVARRKGLQWRSLPDSGHRPRLQATFRHVIPVRGPVPSWLNQIEISFLHHPAQAAHPERLYLPNRGEKSTPALPGTL